jgi:hypothetical protein
LSKRLACLSFNSLKQLKLNKMQHIVSPENTIKWSKIIIVCGIGVLLIGIYQIYSDSFSIYNGFVIAFQIPQIIMAMKTINDAKSDVNNKGEA